MTILGIGVDLVHLPRIRALLLKRSNNIQLLARRILTQKERADLQLIDLCQKLQVNDFTIQYLASRWAVKEAAYKALYPHRRLTWKDVLIVKQANKPRLIFADPTAFTFVTQIHMSLSHDGEYTIAQVMFEGKEGV